MPAWKAGRSFSSKGMSRKNAKSVEKHATSVWFACGRTKAGMSPVTRISRDTTPENGLAACNTDRPLACTAQPRKAAFTRNTARIGRNKRAARLIQSILIGNKVEKKRPSARSLLMIMELVLVLRSLRWHPAAPVPQMRADQAGHPLAR